MLVREEVHSKSRVMMGIVGWRVLIDFIVAKYYFKKTNLESEST